MILPIVLSTLLLTAYVLMVVWMYPALKQVGIATGNQPAVSVIIPFRNEEQSVVEMLHSLRKQDYGGVWEVILVNDHSQDDSVPIVQHFIAGNGLANFRLFHSPKGKEGKKNAIAVGVAHAQGAVVVQTDADCTMDGGWLTILMGSFDRQVKLLLGPVSMLPQQGFWSRFAALEFMSLQATGAAFALRGKPIMGSAANMAYQKSLGMKLSITGTELSSGDDVFMIQALAKEEPQGLKFILHPSAQTYTLAPATFKEFIAQRARWGSKTTSYTSPWAVAAALLVACISVVMVLLLGFAFFHPLYIVLFFGVLLIKAVADYLFLKRYAQITQQQTLLTHFFGTALLYPFYILMVGIAMLFSVNWKGRVITK